jgi:hypothetical protein
MSKSISHMVLQRRRQRGRKEYSHPLTCDSRSFRRIEKHGAWAMGTYGWRWLKTKRGLEIF